jgi:hypothetical protein
MAIYGDMLVYYSEQFQTFECFKQVARVGSGYDKLGDTFNVTGIIQTGEGASAISATGRLSQYAGWRVLATPEKKELWTYQKIDFGTYFYYDDEIYVIGKRKDWSREAGFYAYGVDQLVGDNGEMTGSLPIKVGTF